MKATINGVTKRFSFSPPSTTGRMWANKGWVFLFVTTDGVDLDGFEADYVSAVEGAGRPEFGNRLPATSSAQAFDDLPAPTTANE